MKNFVKALATIIRDKVLHDANQGSKGTLESRFIFQGPPLELLEPVFDELSSNGGIDISVDPNATPIRIPVLLLLPPSKITAPNPSTGASGKCDEIHLLHVRNDPNNPSYLCLVPPGQHSNRSVASTTEEFGVSAANNTQHANFEQWWDDGFTQMLVHQGLRGIGLVGNDAIADAKVLVQRAAAALDETEQGEARRTAVWRLLSRIYSIGGTLGLPPGIALSLVCCI